MRTRTYLTCEVLTQDENPAYIFQKPVGGDHILVYDAQNMSFVGTIVFMEHEFNITYIKEKFESVCIAWTKRRESGEI